MTNVVTPITAVGELKHALQEDPRLSYLHRAPQIAASRKRLAAPRRRYTSAGYWHGSFAAPVPSAAPVTISYGNRNQVLSVSLKIEIRFTAISAFDVKAHVSRGENLKQEPSVLISFQIFGRNLYHDMARWCGETASGGAK